MGTWAEGNPAEGGVRELKRGGVKFVGVEAREKCNGEGGWR